MFRNIIRLTLFFIFSVVAGYLISAQESKPDYKISPQGDTINIQPVQLSQITSSIEKAYDVMKKAKKNLVTDVEFEKFDSVYNAGMKDLNKNNKAILKNEKNLDIRDIDNYLQRWETNLNQANLWKNKIQDRIKILNNDLFNIAMLKEQWELTYKNARESGVPNNVLTSVSELITKLKTFEKDIKKQQNESLKKQNNLTKTLLIIDSTITALNNQKSTIQSDYLRQDSPPLWNAADSTINAVSLKKLINQSFETNQKSFTLFIESNKNIYIFHTILFFILWGLLFFLYKYSSKQGFAEDNQDENKVELTKARDVISRHVISALIIGLFFSLWFYPSMIISVIEVIQLSYIIIAIIFLPAFLNKKIKPFLYAILIIFFINIFQVMIPAKTLFTRIILLTENILGTWILYQVIKSGKTISVSLKENKWEFFLKLVPVFFAFLVASFIANVFGFVNIAVLLSNTVVNSIINFIIVVLVVRVLNSAFSILLRMPLVLKLNLIRNHLYLIEKRIHQTVRLIAILLWFKSIFKNLNIYNNVYEWTTGLIQTSWSIGKTTIEFGGILNFFLIIVITYYVAGFVKSILKEEVFPRIRLPRGVPGAITMITGYFIAGYGIFLAIAAMGVDLGKFGLLAGTLGVGIGFGLQGIVANFIAGLVLAFERPIQVGDTIEVNNLMGDVVSIGVRSSTIRTFDGSEVIIPNSTLITNDVVNWTLSDRKKRRDIHVGVAYGSDPHQVIEIIKKVASEHPNVLKTPAPWALFDGFGDSSLNFRIRIWTTMDTGMTTKSDVAIGVYDALAEAGIEIPFPQQDIHLRSIDPDIEKKAFREKTEQNKKKPQAGKKQV